MSRRFNQRPATFAKINHSIAAILGAPKPLIQNGFSVEQIIESR